MKLGERTTREQMDRPLGIFWRLALAATIVLPLEVSAQAFRKCDVTRQTRANDGPWGMPTIPSCALEINATIPVGNDADRTPIHVLDCAHGVFTPIMDVFSAQIRMAPDGNERFCNDLKKGQRPYLDGSAVVVQRGLCTMWKKVRTAMKAGAGAIIMADNAEGGVLSRMRASKPAKNEANAMPLIPAIMVSQASGVHLQGLLNASSGGAVVVTIRSAYDRWSGLREEIRTWDRVVRAQDTAPAGAMTMLHWVLRRASWKDDADRARAYADKMASKLATELEKAAPAGSSGLANHAEERSVLLGSLQARNHSTKIAELIMPDQRGIYQRMARLYPRVCEVGMHTGFAALEFLQAGATSYSAFAVHSPPEDALADQAAMVSKAAAESIASMYGDRFHVVWGDPAERIARIAEVEEQRQASDPGTGRDFECDLVFIDGAGPRTGRSLSLFSKLVAPDHLIIMTNTPCGSDFCKLPNVVYETAEMRGEISTLHRQHFSPHGAGSPRATGFSIAQYADDSSRVATTIAKGHTIESMVANEIDLKHNTDMGTATRQFRMDSVNELKKHSDPETIAKVEEMVEEEKRVKARARKRREKEHQRILDEQQKETEATEGEGEGEGDADAASEAEATVAAETETKPASSGKKKAKKVVDVDDLMASFGKRFEASDDEEQT